MTSSYNSGMYRTDSAARDKYNKNYIEGKGRGRHGLFDTWGTTDGLFNMGGRQKDLEELADTAKYTPGEGYKLNWWQKNVSGITDQDVYNAKRSREVQDLRNKYGDDAEELGITIDGRTSVAGLRNQVKNAKDIKELTTTLRDTKGGSAKIAELEQNGPLTPGRLRTAITDLNEFNRTSSDEYKAQQALLKQQTLAAQEQIAASQAATALADKTQSFQETQLESQQNWQREQARNRWQDKKEQRMENALTREMNAQNNAMQLQLEYSRLERQDKQDRQDRRDRMIMTLMRGLDNLGSAFTL